MSKFLVTNLIREEFLAAEPVAEVVKARGRGKKLYVAVAMALLVIAMTLGGYVILTKFVIKEPELVARPNKPATPIEPRPADTTKPRPPTPTPRKPVVSTGLKQIPWIGAVGELLSKIPKVKGELYSIATGPEGVVIFSGVVPGENTDVNAGETLFPDANLKNIKVLSVKPVTGGVKYVATGELIPIKKIDFDPEPVPPYSRGQVLRELDSMAISSGLTEVETEAVGSEEISGGSRYLIAIRGVGELVKVSRFVSEAENSGWMLEISNFSLDGVSGGPIEENRIKMGLIFRIYNLPKIAPVNANITAGTTSTETAS